MLENLRFEKITNRTVLEYVKTASMLQDSQGFMWFGTGDGLVRYDGNSFKIFKHESDDKYSLMHNEILFLYRSSTGNILIVTSHKNLIELDIVTEQFKEIVIPFNDAKLIMRTIIEDTYGNLWIGTFENGLYKFNKEENVLSEFKKTNNVINNSINCDCITCFNLDKNLERLYIGTFGGGINIYDFKTQNFSYLCYDEIDSNSLSNNKVDFIFRDSKDKLWVGTWNGLNLYCQENDGFNRFYNNPLLENSLSGNHVKSICEDMQGILWIGTIRNGLNSFDSEKEIFTRFVFNKMNPNGVPHNSIGSLLRDNTNVIWIGTNDGGIGKFDREQKKFYNIRNDSSEPENDVSNGITSIYEDYDNTLWLGTYRDGLYKCNKDLNNKFVFEKCSKINSKFITSISTDLNNNLWVTGDRYGLYKLDFSRTETKQIDAHFFNEESRPVMRYINCLCKDNINQNISYFGFSFPGFKIFDLLNEKLVENNLITDTFEDISVRCIFMDSNNYLWIGSDTGSYLFRYEKNLNTLTRYIPNADDSESISDSGIIVILEDHNNNLWFGTMNNGINKLDKNGISFKRFNEKNGLINNQVRGMILDDFNNLWISTKRGLSKLDTTNYSFTNFIESDGLQGDEFNDRAFFKSNKGTLYFGGKNGITYFKPEEIKTNPYIPNIVLTDFQIFYESVKPSPDNPFLKKSISYVKEITLSYKESVITFEFAALIFNNPKKNEYAYKMEGFDEDWVYCGNRRTATYTNLDPGEYKFRVKGSNNDGLWNEGGTSIKVIITPPWYKTVLFKGLVGLSVIGSIGSFYRKRIQKLNKEKSQQEEFTKKLIESQENERKRVAAELHDSLGQDLLIIKNKALVSIKKNEPEKLLEQMNEISDLTSATLNDVREISYNLRPYELDRLGLTKTIKSMIERANNSTSINFAADIDDIDKVFIPEVEINFYRIIQESLNNVIKHSEASEVNLIIKRSEKEIDINISDNGKGFDIRKYSMKPEKNGFGLKGIEERVRLMNGEFRIESGIGKGTVVNIQLKVRS